jgi:hypothetical protein
MEIPKSQKIPKKFSCKFCNVECSHKGDWNKHILTTKHKNNILGKEWKSEEIKISPKNKYLCNCGKIYMTKSGLWKHSKICGMIPEDYINDEIPSVQSNQIVTALLHQNQEFKELIIEQNKQMQEQYKHMQEQNKENQKLQQQLLQIAKEGKTINNNTTNNSFNLQFFLNEQCKDALNITDFISQLQLKLTDLDMVGRVGYSEGISKIFIRGLKELDVFKRPIHCSDLKRETLYVKDKNLWEKDNQDKEKIKTAIKYIAAKNFKQIHEWQEENPESENIDSKKHMDYHCILMNSMGGANEEDDESNYNKIIKNVAKEVIIDKSLDR